MPTYKDVKHLEEAAGHWRRMHSFVVVEKDKLFSQDDLDQAEDKLRAAVECLTWPDRPSRSPYILNEEEWNSLVAALDAPAKANEALKKLMAKRPPWAKQVDE